MIAEMSGYLQQSPVLVFFLVLSLGYLVGNLRVSSVQLGPAGGVMLVGLLFGHFGFEMSSAAQAFGFVLFIFCVGYQAGPQFIDVLLSDGLKYLCLSLVVAATGFAVAVLFSIVLGLDPGFAAGILGGSMTTTPTLAAAQEAVHSDIAKIEPGFTKEQILNNIGAGYALTYLFGLMGLSLIIRLMPKMMGVDLSEEAKKISVKGESISGPVLGEITHRMYKVTQEKFLGRPVRELEKESKDMCAVALIRRDGIHVPIEEDTCLTLGDEVLVVGKVSYIIQNVMDFGEEIHDKSSLEIPMRTSDVVVSNPRVIGKPVKNAQLDEHIGVLVLGIRRQRSALPLTPDLILKRGDVITVHGPEFANRQLTEYIGHVEEDVDQTDMFTFALGICVGILLGELAVKLGGVTIKIGMAGGLLVSGLTIGFLRSMWPVFGRVPSASRWMLMELGLLMFMAGVGVNSGGGIMEVIKSSGIKLIFVGVFVTSLPVFLGYIFGRKILKLNPAEVLGGITGAMTSGAAIRVVTDSAKSDAPYLGYTGAYAFANVILTVAGTLIMII